MESQKSQVKEILLDVKTMKDTVEGLPQKSDIEDSQNTTLEKLEEIKFENTLIPEKTAELLQLPLNKIQEDLDSTSNETLKNLNELFVATVTLTESFSINYEKIRAEIHALGKLEQVMLRAADDVLDTKRRVEYGVHQILADVSKQLKDSTKDISEGINDR